MRRCVCWPVALMATRNLRLVAKVGLDAGCGPAAERVLLADLMAHWSLIAGGLTFAEGRQAFGRQLRDIGCGYEHRSSGAGIGRRGDRGSNRGLRRAGNCPAVRRAGGGLVAAGRRPPPTKSPRMASPATGAVATVCMWARVAWKIDGSPCIRKGWSRDRLGQRRSTVPARKPVPDTVHGGAGIIGQDAPHVFAHASSNPPDTPTGIESDCCAQGRLAIDGHTLQRPTIQSDFFDRTDGARMWLGPQRARRPGWNAMRRTLITHNAFTLRKHPAATTLVSGAQRVLRKLRVNGSAAARCPFCGSQRGYSGDGRRQRAGLFR